MRSGSPRIAASTKAGTTAAHARPAGWSGPYTLKKRNGSTGSPKHAPYARTHASVASLLAPYGLSGRVGRSSCLGSAATEPYTDEDEAATTCTDSRRHASSTRTVPVAFTSWLASGSASDRGTDGRAARCTTASASATSRASTAASRQLP